MPASDSLQTDDRPSNSREWPVRAYFDESGTHAQSRVTMIGGYVATCDVWKAIEAQWNEVLTNQGLSWFHMTDAMEQRGEFELIETPVIHDIVWSLGSILQKSDVCSVSIAVDAVAWNEVTTEKFRERFRKPYDYCFSNIHQALIHWSRQTGNSSPIAMVFGTQDEYSGRAETIVNAWTQYRGGEIGPLEFAPAKQTPALQAADMLVHELHAAWEQFARGLTRPGKIVQSALCRAIDKGEFSGGGYLGAAALKLRVDNADWFDPTFRCPSEKSAT